MSKQAHPDDPIHDLLVRRWSPYGFSDRSVSREDLRSLLEAARWAASSYNEQPWHYIIATKDEPEEFQRLLTCLVEPNQVWAKHAPVLMLAVVSNFFKKNNKPNKAAIHDLGLAAGNLTLEATARDLHVHQMIGIEPERARRLYAIPEGFDAYTALAIGYAADPAQLPEKLRERDLAPRRRRPLREFVFASTWGKTAELVKSKA